MTDVLVLALVGAAVRCSWRWGTRAAALAAAGVGALTLGEALVGLAVARGSSAAGLWEAVVDFRWLASGVIASEASSATPHRGAQLFGALLLSGAPVLLGAALVAHRRHRVAAPGETASRRLLLALTLSALSWETVGVVAGGSYWLHYLLGVVPGLVLATVVAAGLGVRPRRRWLVAALVPVAVARAVTLVVVGLRAPQAPPGASAAAFVRHHARPGDTATVAFGNAAAQRATGMSSPYPYLWSLPVRVRDPRLARLSGLLAGPRAPTWLVVRGASLATWGVDDSTARREVERRYQPAATRDGYTIYRLQARDAS